MLRTTVLIALFLGYPISSAVAHSGTPVPNSIYFGPAGSDDLFLGTAVGAVISRDGGEHWYWICEEAWGGVGYPPVHAWLDDGTANGILFSAVHDQLAYSRDGGCTWFFHSDFTSVGAYDIAVDPQNPGRIYVATAAYSHSNGLYVSNDGGNHFELTSLVSDTMVFDSLALSPSNDQRIYVGGKTKNVEERWILRSSDGGVHWQQFLQSTPLNGAFKVLGVDPTQPDIVYAAIYSRPSRLWRSVDGGEVFSEVLSFDDMARPPVFGDDGLVWVPTSSGLYRSDNHGESFTRQAIPTTNACLNTYDEELYACGSESSDGWSMASSLDQGQHWQSRLVLRHLSGMLQCPADSTVAHMCKDLWPAVAALIGAPLPALESPSQTNQIDLKSSSCANLPSASSAIFVVVALVFSLIRCRLKSEKR